MPIMIMPGIVCIIRLFRLYGYHPFLISIKIILNMRICENNYNGSSTYLPRSSGISTSAFSVISLALLPFFLHSYILRIQCSSTFLQQNLFYFFLSPLRNY